MMVTVLKDLGYEYATENSKKRETMLWVSCGECGKEFKARATSVKRGLKSCGCIRKKIGERSLKTKHLKESNKRLYRIWLNMGTRCNNPNIKQAVNYSEKGIQRDCAWNDYAVFYEWAMTNGYDDKLTIDRKDNDEDYTPDNCRWITYKEQMKNTSLLRSTNTSGYRGVHKVNNKFVARCTGVDGKRVYIGAYDNAEEAGKAYDEYVICNDLGYPLNFGSSIGSKEKDNHIKELKGK